MSIEAMVWALKSAPVPDPISHLVLIGLADHAAADGTGARPSVATLADYARCSPRSVYNKLRALEDSGVIRRGDQRAVEHLRADRRPVVYDLVYGVQLLHSAGYGVNGGAERGARPGTDGVNVSADRTVLEPSVNRPSVNDQFADFWAVYPRRVGKVKARAAFAAALKAGADPADVIEGARRYAGDPNREERFTAHPTTWLNRGSWEDEPLPGRGPRDRQGEILAAELAAARQADAGRFGQLAIGGGFDA